MDSDNSTFNFLVGPLFSQWIYDSRTVHFFIYIYVYTWIWNTDILFPNPDSPFSIFFRLKLLLEKNNLINSVFFLYVSLFFTTFKKIKKKVLLEIEITVFFILLSD